MLRAACASAWSKPVAAASEKKLPVIIYFHGGVYYIG
jgi:carboxylesterase type B